MGQIVNPNYPNVGASNGQWGDLLNALLKQLVDQGNGSDSSLAGVPEQAQDAVASMLAAGSHTGITFVYDDAGNRLSATVTGGGGGSGGGTPLGIVNVRDYNAAGNGTTDDTTAVKNAIAAVAGRSISGDATGIVYFPPGVYRITTTLSIPKNITLVGESMLASKLVYDGPTDAAGVFTTWGASGTININGGVRAMQVNAGGKLAWAMLMYGPQEGSAIYAAHVCGGTIGGADLRSKDIEGGTNKFVVERSWIWTSGNGGMYGLKFDDANGPLSVRDTTIVGTGRTQAPPAGSAGLHFSGGYQIVEDVNVEIFESHTSIDAWSNLSGRAWSSYNQVKYGLTRRDYAGSDPGVRAVVENLTIDSAAGQSGAYIRDLKQGITVATCKRWSNREIDSASWSGAHLTIGSYHLWVDATGDLRIKATVPTADTDGAVVGTQS